MADFNPNEYTYYDPQTGEIIIEMSQEFRRYFMLKLRSVVRRMTRYLRERTGVDITYTINMIGLFEEGDLTFRVVVVTSEYDYIYGRDHLDRLIPPTNVFVNDIFRNIQNHLPDYTLVMTGSSIETDELSTRVVINFVLE